MSGMRVTRWATFIDAPKAGEHAVQIYRDLADLVISVTSYLDAGLRAGAPAVVIATPRHRQQVGNALTELGWDLDALQAEGRVELLDAEETLSAIMDGDKPSAAKFRRAVADPVDQMLAAFPGRTLRAFGEMVDVLWHRGLQDAAVALEGLWNELAATRNFALLCGYELDVLDPEVQAGPLPDVLRRHSHVGPVADASALDHTLRETVGPLETARIYLAVAEDVPPSKVPRTQVMLSWLSRNKPPVARRVMESLRSAR
jgi:MEDS: MEthanogen/methylotroph, DcmR Sensory domain